MKNLRSQVVAIYARTKELEVTSLLGKRAIKFESEKNERLCHLPSRSLVMLP